MANKKNHRLPATNENFLEVEQTSITLRLDFQFEHPKCDAGQYILVHRYEALAVRIFFYVESMTKKCYVCIF